MPDEKLTRRLFLEQSAMATAMFGACYSVAMKTDAVAQAQQTQALAFLTPGGPSSYAYDDESP